MKIGKTLLAIVLLLILMGFLRSLILPHLSLRTSSYPLQYYVDNALSVPKIIEYSYNGRSELLSEEIESGADVNERFDVDQPREGYTPLAGAIYANSYESVKLLLKAGANPNISFHSPMLFWNIFMKLDYNTRNAFPLSFALYRKTDIGIIKLLIEYGAAVNISHSFYVKGLTPLMLAIITGNKEAFQLLLQAGADPKIKNSIDGRDAFDYARIYDWAYPWRWKYFIKDAFSNLLNH